MSITFNGLARKMGADGLFFGYFDPCVEGRMC